MAAELARVKGETTRQSVSREAMLAEQRRVASAIATMAQEHQRVAAETERANAEQERNGAAVNGGGAPESCYKKTERALSKRE